MFEKSRNRRRASLISGNEVVGRKNSNTTPCHAFFLEGQDNRRQFAEYRPPKQTGQKGESYALHIFILKFESEKKIDKNLVVMKYYVLEIVWLLERNALWWTLVLLMYFSILLLTIHTYCVLSRSILLNQY